MPQMPAVLKRSYRDITIAANSQNHFGDYYNYGAQPTRKQKLLQSLYFAEMFHSRALEAYEGTYEWVFDDQATSFANWARSGENVETYWITGKAGSGKSTLMNFLVDHEHTQNLLQDWAGEAMEPVVIAHFFLWDASTSKMKKSQLGLMQALLYQLIDACSDDGLEGIAQHRRTEEDSVWRRPWKRKELSRTLHSLVHDPPVTAKGRRLCIFVDGLDEYELDNPDEGNYDDLIAYLHTLAASPLVKLCVASRPWNVFKQAYAGQPQIIMQDLTAKDMAKFIHSRLFADRFFNDEDIQGLVAMIQEAADGVFQWVHLAVKDVRRGIVDRDDIVTLRHRIEDYPRELDDFLERIFRSIERVHEKCAARALSLMLEDMWTSSPSAYNLLQFSFLEQLVATALDTTNQSFPMTRDQATDRMYRAQSLINKWCKDLLEVTFVPGTGRPSRRFGYDFDAATIGFPHRTIADFVRTKARDGVLNRMAGGHLSVFKDKWSLIILMLKGAPDGESMRSCAGYALSYLENTFERRNRDYTQAFDELDAVCASRMTPSTGVHWSVTMDNIYLVAALPTTPAGYSVLSLALLSRLVGFAVEALSDPCRVYTSQQLCYALTILLIGSHPWAHFGEYPECAAVNQLLCRQSTWDFNRPCIRWRKREYNAWQLFLSTVATSARIALKTEHEFNNVKCIVEQFLLHGADPHARIYRSDMAVETAKHLERLGANADVLKATQVFDLLHIHHANLSTPHNALGATRYLELKVVMESAAYKEGVRTGEAASLKQEQKRSLSRLRAALGHWGRSS